MLQNTVLAVATHQHESVTGIHVSSFSNFPPTSRPFPPSRLLQSPGFSSLSQTANSHQLYILQIVKYIYINTYTSICFHAVVSFDVWKFLVQMKTDLSIFFPFVAYAFGVIFKKSLPNPTLWRLSPLFSSNSFIFLALIYLFDTFELTIVYCLKQDSPSFLCIWISSFPSTICWKDCSSPIACSR